MKIYSPSNILLLEEVDDKSYQQENIMGLHNVTIYVSHTDALKLSVGSYLDFEGIRYTIRKKTAIKKLGSRNLEYTAVFDSPQSDTEKRTVRNTVDNRLKFPYTARPKEHIQLIVDNLNKISTGWKVGTCIDAVEALVSYNHTKCSDALQMIAETFNTEWEINNKTIHLRTVEYNKTNPLALSYGSGNGFKTGITRENVDSSVPIEILAVQGGSRNIDFSKYGSNELLLPKNQRLSFDGAFFEGQTGYNSALARTYIVDADGLTIRRADKQLITFEDSSTDLSNIYPSRVGTVTSVYVDANGNYDFVDNTIPATLDFSKLRINGEKMTVIFQSGMLSTREFDIMQTDTAVTGYVHSERRFKLVSQALDGVTMPNATFAQKIGDKYAVFGMMMPDQYIRDDATKTGASWDMFRESVRVLFTEEQDKFSFTGELDGIWANKDWTNIGGKIVLGGFIRFTDNQMLDPNEQGVTESVLIRITGIKKPVNNPHFPEITLANVTAATYSSDFRKIDENEVVAEKNNENAIQFTRRGFRDSAQSIIMLQSALLNFTGSINPVTVQAMLLLIGDESLQFRFVNNKTNPVQVSFNITYDAVNRRLKTPAGIMQHMTIGINSISSSHKVNEYKFWDMPAFISAELTDPGKKYFLYAKVSKSGTPNTFLLSETAIALEGVSGYYHLLTGFLNSEFENTRSYVDMYGFTEIAPGRITTDRIVSSDGLNFFDFVANQLKIGDANSGLDWNNTVANQLTIRGLINALGAILGGFEINNTEFKSIAKDTDTNNPMIKFNGSNGSADIYGKFNFHGLSGTITTIDPNYEFVVKYAGQVIAMISVPVTEDGNVSSKLILSGTNDKVSELLNGRLTIHSGQTNTFQVTSESRNLLIKAENMQRESTALKDYWYVDDNGFIKQKK